MIVAANSSPAMPTFLRSPAHRLLIARLKEARKAKGLRQFHVAKRLGVQQSYIAKVEGGERRLDLIEFLAYMRALEVYPIALVEELVPVVDLPKSDADESASSEQEVSDQPKAERKRNKA